MGGGQSTPIPGGGTHGYHVLKVQENSPAALSQLEAYFDFIVTIQGLRLDRESDTLIEILKVHLDREVKLGVYNVKGRSWREVGLVPNKKWGGQGVIGVSIRFCSFENVSDNIWHILEVYPNSPADKAGLCSNTDYIIGYEMMDEEFDTFIEQNNRKEVKLFVYNVTVTNVAMCFYLSNYSRLRLVSGGGNLSLHHNLSYPLLPNSHPGL